MIRTFPLTYPQLMNQAAEAGYDETALAGLRKAYEMCVELFDGVYRGQGVPLIDHLVRTAGIVMAEGQSLETVKASLLHSLYIFGQFRDGRRGGLTPAHRDKICRKVDGRTEELVALYTQLPFRGEEVLRGHLEKLESYSDSEKQVLLMRLANELEDYMDYAMVYRGVYPFREIIERQGGLMTQLARKLGHARLAGELDEVFSASLNCTLPQTVKMCRRDAYESPDRALLRKGELRYILSGLKKNLRSFFRESRRKELSHE